MRHHASATVLLCFAAMSLAAQADAARKDLAGYYAHCTAIDKCVGNLLATLQETGLAEHTIVVFTADHGEMVGAHSVTPMQKQWPYDEAVHVPFLLRAPRAPAHVVKTPINAPDVLPTLLGVAGIPIPKAVEGKDLLALANSAGPGPDRAALVMSVSPFVAPLEGIQRHLHVPVHLHSRPGWPVADARQSDGSLPDAQSGWRPGPRQVAAGTRLAAAG